MQEETIPSVHSFQAKFQKIIVLANELEKKPAKFGTDCFLSGAEIHLIEMIGDRDGVSLTEIANILGVTKGAVSQNLKKVEQKGLVSKNEAPENQSRYRLSLTTEGNTAYIEHKNWHDTMDGGFRDYMDGLDSEKIVVIDEFLTMVQRFLQSGLERTK